MLIEQLAFQAHDFLHTHSTGVGYSRIIIIFYYSDARLGPIRSWLGVGGTTTVERSFQSVEGFLS